MWPVKSSCCKVLGLGPVAFWGHRRSVLTQRCRRCPWSPLCILLLLSLLALCCLSVEGPILTWWSSCVVPGWVGCCVLLCIHLVPSLIWILVSLLLLFVLCRDLRCCSPKVPGESALSWSPVHLRWMLLLSSVLSLLWLWLLISLFLLSVAPELFRVCWLLLLLLLFLLALVGCLVLSRLLLLACHAGVGIGSGCFACWVAGAVAIGRSVSASGGMFCGCPVTVGCGLCWVSVLVVSCCFLAAGCGSTTMLGAVTVTGIMAGEELMVSINCLLYLSGLICLRMVLALTTLLLMPRIFSFVEVSLPNQMAG